MINPRHKLKPSPHSWTRHLNICTINHLWIQAVPNGLPTSTVFLLYRYSPRVLQIRRFNGLCQKAGHHCWQDSLSVHPVHMAQMGAERTLTGAGSTVPRVDFSRTMVNVVSGLTATDHLDVVNLASPSRLAVARSTTRQATRTSLVFA